MASMNAERLERELVIRRLAWSDLGRVVSVNTVTKLKNGQRVTPRIALMVEDFLNQHPVSPLLESLHPLEQAS